MVFGLGLGRTGTLSLWAALNRLGIRTVHCLDYVAHLRTDGHAVSLACIDQLMKTVQGIANGTGLPYRDLDKRYPGSRFILTLRDVDAWLASKKRLVEREAPGLEADPAAMAARRNLYSGVYSSVAFDRARWRSAYEEHVAGVREYFDDREDLLELDITAGDGWDKLCRFIEARVPDAPFPHRNRNGAFDDHGPVADCHVGVTARATVTWKPRRESD